MLEKMLEMLKELGVEVQTGIEEEMTMLYVTYELEEFAQLVEERFVEWEEYIFYFGEEEEEEYFFFFKEFTVRVAE